MLVQVTAVDDQYAQNLFDFYAANNPDASLASFLSTLPIFPTVAGKRIAPTMDGSRWSSASSVMTAVIGSTDALPPFLRV